LSKLSQISSQSISSPIVACIVAYVWVEGLGLECGDIDNGPDNRASEVTYNCIVRATASSMIVVFT
jgi:hypothetical protein